MAPATPAGLLVMVRTSDFPYLAFLAPHSAATRRAVLRGGG